MRESLSYGFINKEHEDRGAGRLSSSPQLAGGFESSHTGHSWCQHVAAVTLMSPVPMHIKCTQVPTLQLPPQEVASPKSQKPAVINQCHGGSLWSRRGYCWLCLHRNTPWGSYKLPIKAKEGGGSSNLHKALGVARPRIHRHLFQNRELH